MSAKAVPYFLVDGAYHSVTAVPCYPTGVPCVVKARTLYRGISVFRVGVSAFERLAEAKAQAAANFHVMVEQQQTAAQA